MAKNIGGRGEEGILESEKLGEKLGMKLSFGPQGVCWKSFLPFLSFLSLSFLSLPLFFFSFIKYFMVHLCTGNVLATPGERSCRQWHRGGKRCVGGRKKRSGMLGNRAPFSELGSTGEGVMAEGWRWHIRFWTC